MRPFTQKPLPQRAVMPLHIRTDLCHDSTSHTILQADQKFTTSLCPELVQNADDKAATWPTTDEDCKHNDRV